MTAAISLWFRDRHVVADVGAGTGRRAAALADEGHVAVAIDVDESRLSTLGRTNGTVLALVADATRLPFPNSHIDALLCLETLEHVGDWRRAVRELARVARSGGRLVLSVPTVGSERLFRRLHSRWAEMSGHLEVIDEQDLEGQLVAAGWVVTSKLRLHGIYTLMWLLFAPLQTPFDDTGTPLRYRPLQKLFWGTWRVLSILRLRSHAEGLLNRYLAKSILLVCGRT